MKLHPGSRTSYIIMASGAPRGVSLAEARQSLGSTPHYLSSLLSELVQRGELFVAGPHCHKRYFAKAEDRDEWAKVADAEVAAERAAKKADPAYIERKRAKWREIDKRLRDAKRMAAKPAPAPKLAVKPAKPKLAPVDRISTTPKRAKQGESGRGRGIIIGSQSLKGQKQASTAPIIPAHVKVQVCPSGRDARFDVDPSIAGRGAVTAAWLEERQKQREQAP